MRTCLGEVIPDHASWAVQDTDAWPSALDEHPFQTRLRPPEEAYEDLHRGVKRALIQGKAVAFNCNPYIIAPTEPGSMYWICRAGCTGGKGSHRWPMILTSCRGSTYPTCRVLGTWSTI